MLNRSVIDERAIYTKRAEDYAELVRRFGDPGLREVGNYRLGDEIGSGAFGKVYIAHHKLLGSKVVVKKGDRVTPSGCNDNLMREYYYLKEFGAHPNVTKLYELILTETSAFMVLEFCPEGDLFEYLSRHKRLSLEESLRMFVQLASAVHYMHRSGCCHRDLKLENVLLDKKHNVKLSDFGFAREFPMAQHGPRGLLNDICGTSAYMAPELLRKTPYVGTKTDIWALGVILYTLVAGEMPFDDSLDEDALVVAVCEREPTYNPELFGPELLPLARKMLAKDPDRRASSLDEVLRAPVLHAYGGLAQLELISRLLYRTAPALELSHKDKFLLKELTTVGIDKDTLKHTIYHETMDQVYGFWQLAREKNRKGRTKRIRHRSRSMLRIPTSKSFMESRLSSTPEQAAQPVQQLPEPQRSAAPSAQSSDQSSLRKGGGFSLKRLLGRMRPSREHELQPVLPPSARADDTARQELSAVSPTQPVSANVVVIEPPRSPRVKNGGTSADNTPRAVRPQSLVSSYSMQTTVSETSNGSGYNTGYSTDTNLNGTGTTLGSHTGPLAHSSTSGGRPQYARGLSDWSLNSKNVASQPTSPTSSFTTVSRSNSLESASRSVRGRSRRRKSSGIFGTSGNSNGFLSKRGKSPLQSKINTKWSFGAIQKSAKENRFGKSSKQQQIIEEEAEDDESEDELLNETEYADGELEEMGDSEFEQGEVQDVAEQLSNYKLDQPADRC
ncbi:hypothetical protein KL935_004541 [Ogataea polymorpha]|uniref:non-specific serine/threonine protein kinase n=1 Tax=Ogataea polymorpha TaxID=460523 RepID=A0A9P8SXJ2_9ASCO|nr:hypothetical protein KL935_004541 [Ogataea polymorpha]KAH3659088.1 hypothetical protein OGATHE_006348 [Ogataea polymorpha]